MIAKASYCYFWPFCLPSQNGHCFVSFMASGVVRWPIGASGGRRWQPSVGLTHQPGSLPSPGRTVWRTSPDRCPPPARPEMAPVQTRPSRCPMPLEELIERWLTDHHTVDGGNVATNSWQPYTHMPNTCTRAHAHGRTSVINPRAGGVWL